MKKEPLAVIFTDLHLNDLNREICWKFIQQMIEDIKKIKPQFIIFGGDFYDIRGGLTETTLTLGKQIFKEIKDTYIYNYWVVGNHDKYIKTYEKSYLQVYEEFTTHVYSLVGGFTNIDSKQSFVFFSYFEGQEFENQLNELIKIIKESKEKGNQIILFAHYMYEDLPIELTQYCDKIFLGHNHEREELPNKKGYYLGSCIQNGFSEDKYKGYNILYKDLSIKQIIFKDKEYITQIVDLNTFSEEKIKEFILEFKNKNPNKYLRIELQGFSKDITDIKEFCKQNNINCISKLNNNLIEENYQEQKSGFYFSELSKEQLKQQFENFSKNQIINENVKSLINKYLWEEN